MEVRIIKHAPRLKIHGRPRLTHAVLKMLKMAGIDLGTRRCDSAGPSPEFLVVFLDAERIRRLNWRFTGRDMPTDVLAFDYREGADAGDGAEWPGSGGAPFTVGEVVVCPDLAERVVARFKSTPPVELMRYVAHGILHIAGGDDHTREGRAAMRRQERRLLAAVAREFAIDDFFVFRDDTERRPVPES